MNIPQSLVINSINPAVVLINVEALTQKEVPVTPRFIGSLPQGYILKRYTVSPSEVAITGAERFVNVTRKVFLKAIDLEEIKEVPDSGSLTIKTLADFTTKNIWLQNHEEFSVELIIDKL
jgi:YbbR domain-containing protein